MPFGFQWLPGAPTDPNQAEQPSIPELLGILAGNIYGGDQRYSAAAGLGTGAADIFSGMRTKREEVRAFQQLKKLYPDMPLVPGMKPPSFSDLVTLQQQNQSDESMKTLLDTIAKRTAGTGAAGPAAPTAGGPLMTMPEALQFYQGTGKFPPNAFLGGQKPLTMNQESIAANSGLFDASGSPRAPQNQQEWQRYYQSAQAMTTGAAATKTGAEEAARQAARKEAQGIAGSLAPPVRQMLSEWGVEPSSVRPGDPIIGEAREAVGMARARVTMDKQHQQVLESGDKSLQIIAQLRPAMQQVMAAGHSPMSLSAWAKVYDLEQKPEQNKGAIADAERLLAKFGPIPDDVAEYFDLVGQLRVTSNQAYAASLASRAVSAQQAAQSHIPTAYTDLRRVAGQVGRAEGLLRMAMASSSTTSAKREHLIQVFMKAHPDYNRSRASYEIDKRAKLVPEPEGATTAPPSMPVIPPEEAPTGSE